jgi:cobalt/nickel transport system permease protein
MHIPDGFLTDPVCAASTLASAGAIGYGVVRMRDADASRSAALMAAAGAGVFAAQMVNFPVDGGTSGHVIGAAVLAIALGPWRAMLTMAVVLAVQCFVFGDGGLKSLGANVLNMAVVAPFVAASVYQFATCRVSGASGKLLGAGAAAFGSVLAAAAMCAVELAASGTYPIAPVMTAMIAAHLAIALCEALATMALVAAATALVSESRAVSTRNVLVGGLALAVVVAGVLAPLASAYPDGLERVAGDLNFAALATTSYAVLPDYEAPLAGWPMLAVALAGVVGVALVFASTYTVGRTARVRVRKH